MTKNLSDMFMRSYDDIERASSYDANFQSYNGDGFQKSAFGGGVYSSFDLILTNTTAALQKFEMFNELASFIENLRADVVNAPVAAVPQTSLQGLALAGVGIVGFNQAGDMIMTTTGAATAVSVSCPTYSYRALWKSSGKRPFRIIGMRMSFGSDGQIDNQITHFTKNYLGAQSQNILTPRMFFQPSQFQSLLVDVKCNFPIDDQKGLFYSLNANQTVKITFFIVN